MAIVNDSHNVKPTGRMEDDVSRLYKDMYYGNGLPGMVTRMANVEKCLDDYKWTKRIVIVTLLTVIADIVQRHIK